MKKRWEVLIDLLKNEKHDIGVEIGVLKGVTSKQLLDNLPNLKILNMVDPWRGDKEFLNSLDDSRNIKNWNYEKLYEEVKNKFSIYDEKANIIRATSKEASKYFNDKSVDFIFIDGNHSYESVKEDIELWYPKIKIGGWITGHDYDNSIWDKEGVVQAVDEIFDNFEVKDTVWYKKKWQ